MALGSREVARRAQDATVADSPCGRYIAAGAGSDAVVLQNSNGEMLQRLRGHTEDVTCIGFVAGWEKLVSGSRDGKVMVWQWESSELPAQVLERHDDEAMGIAVHSDGGRIFSCSVDGTLRIWD